MTFTMWCLGAAPDGAEGLAYTGLCALRMLAAATASWSLLELVQALGGPWVIFAIPVLLCLTTFFLLVTGQVSPCARSWRSGLVSLGIMALLLVSRHMLPEPASISEPGLLQNHLVSNVMALLACLHALICSLPRQTRFGRS